MLKSVENMVFNGVNLSEQFTDEEAGAYFIVNEVRGRGLQGEENTLIGVAGMDGAYLSRRRKPVRYLEVDITLKGKSFEDLRRRIDRLNEILDTGEEIVSITFDDESDRTYYGKLDTVVDRLEKSKIYQATLTFICPDPFKYGPEKSVETTSDTFIVENEGTAEAEPIIELTATEKATFAMVSNGEEYMIIGKPGEVDEQLVDEKVRVLYERGDTLSEWTSAGTQVDGTVTGQMTTDGTGIVVQSYGTNAGWHGPALMKEIEPIQDFEVAMRLRVEATNPNTTYRIEFYLFDEFMNVLGKMAIMDASRGKIQYAAEGRIGPFVGKYENYLISSRNYQRERSHFHGMLRMKRIGKRFEFYVARIGHTGEEGHIHHDTLTEVFNDVNNQYQGRLRYVQIHIGKYGDTPSAQTPRINAIEVFEHNEVLVDETPYIIYPGDTVEFDHVTKDIRLNGESRKDLKAFGGSFFTLKKGINTLTIMPENAFSTKVMYRERYK